MGAIWKARCECGSIVDVRAKEVAAGRITTCGKCQLKHKNKQERRNHILEVNGSYRRLFNKYVMDALRKEIQWELTPEQVRNIVTKPCIYCAANSSVMAPNSRTYINLVERMDPTIHYHIANVGPVCKECKHWKNGSNSTNFVQRVLNKAEYLRAILGKELQLLTSPESKEDEAINR